MAFLNTTITLSHKASLPKSCTREAALRILRNHDFLIRCDKQLEGYTAITPDKKPLLPDNIQAIQAADTKCYKIKDLVSTVPAGIWSPNVESLGEYTDLKEGIFMRVNNPLSIAAETEWKIMNGDGGLELGFESKIFCSRPLMAMVKGGYDENLQAMLEKIVSKLAEGGD